ncbi:MAG TPA: molybdenum cofactor biosynthesis protein MoaE [Tepidisphaeraceae bacterium]|jgi:molybdopterin synthase catalytic subunit
MTDLIRLTADPLDLAAAVAHCGDPAAGGIAVFLGTTRCETRDGRGLVALDYEAYADMAERQLHDLVAAARQGWPITRCALLHRTGRVAVGEPSVMVVVATPHRAAAFEACRYLIDTLKSSAAIWKHEEWDDGQATWVAGTVPGDRSDAGIPRVKDRKAANDANERE